MDSFIEWQSHLTWSQAMFFVLLIFVGGVFLYELIVSVRESDD